VRRLPEAPGHLYLDQAAVSTSGQHQVPSEEPINFEFEAGDGEAPQLPAPGGSQAVPSVTTGSAVEGSLQHLVSLSENTENLTTPAPACWGSTRGQTMIYILHYIYVVVILMVMTTVRYYYCCRCQIDRGSRVLSSC
jgi:hypothetical protein